MPLISIVIRQHVLREPVVVVVPRGRYLLVTELFADESDLLSLHLKAMGRECVTYGVRSFGNPSVSSNARP